MAADTPTPGTAHTQPGVPAQSGTLASGAPLTGPAADGAGRLQRLLAPRHIAVYGGETAAEAIRQSRAIGYSGQIWPVHPRRDSIEGIPCHRTTAALPSAPDAAFIAVPGEATVGVLADLAARGAGGAVCHASGFAEDGPRGARLEDRLRGAAGDMPVIGPNCIGVLNYLDGSALWADQHGGTRSDRGPAVITQSGNIGQNLTMQRRSLPLSYVITAGNGAVTGIPQLMDGLLDDPRVTAIGLHLEEIADAPQFSRVALRALRQGIPLVVLKTGSSDLGAQTNLSHTGSLAGSDVLCDALFRRVGAARVHEVSTFLETLKLLHVHGPLQPATTTGNDRPQITSASCSGGEAALMADTAQQHGADLPALPEPQAARLRDVLGERVTVRNPLDYHTFIWGDFTAQQQCFSALFGSGADMNLLLLDTPRTDRCATGPWTTTLDACIAAQSDTNAPACVVSSLPETACEETGRRLLAAGIAPMQGIADCIRALAAAAHIGVAQRTAHSALPLDPVPRHSGPGESELLDESAGKRELAAYGTPVPQGAEATAEDAPAVARRLGYPLVAKALAPSLAHKSEAGGVHLGITDDTALREAVAAMSGIADRFLIEELVPDAVAELLVGIHRDPRFGPALTLGAGGVLVELMRDTTTLLLPATREQIRSALAELRVWPVLTGYRGRAAGDLDAVVEAVHAIAAYVRDHDEVTELDVNPLLVLPEGHGAVAADVLMTRTPAPGERATAHPTTGDPA